MDSLFIEYYSLIISTIFYIIYLKFTIFSQNDEDDVDIVPINPNIDEMLHSLKEQLQSVPTPIHPHAVPIATADSSSSKIKAIPVITEAYNELTTPHTEDLSTHNMYYDTLEFEDENEYDSDMLNDYDRMNSKLRTDVNNTLHSIISNASSSSILSSTSSTANDLTIHAPLSIKNEMNKLRKTNMMSIGESGSDDVDHYIQENEFILHEDRTCVEDEFEMDLTNYNVDLSLFPTEQECYPTAS